jgi:fucose permease
MRVGGSFTINEQFWDTHQKNSPTSQDPNVSSRFKQGSTSFHLGAFVLLGCSVLMLGPSLDTFRVGAHVTLSKIGLLVAATSIGYLLGSVVTGRLLQSQPAHRTLGGGMLIVAAALISLTTVHGLVGLAIFECLLGFGGSMVDVTGNTVVLWVHKGGPVMNALHLAFGLGGILGPIVVSRSLIWSGGIRAGYLVVAAVLIALAITILLRPSPDNPHEEGERGFPKGVTRLIVLAVLFFVSYAWLELGFATWIFTYGAARGMDPLRGAAWLGTGFLASFSIGRMIAIPVSAKVAPKMVMLADFIITAAGLLVLLAGGRNHVAMWAGTALVGVGVASMFPSMLSLTEPNIPSTSAVTSTFLVGSSIGSIFLPPLIGALIDRNGPVAMPQMVLAGTFVCAFIVFLFVRSAQHT